MLWTLETEQTEDELQQATIQQLLEKKPHWRLLKVTEWQLPIIIYETKVTSATKTRLDVLKKMIMKLVQRWENVTAFNLVEFLHVDEVFIEDVVRQMLNVHVLEEARDGSLSLTSLGEQQLAAGTVLSSPRAEHFSFHHNALQGEVLPDDPANRWIKDDWLLPSYRYQPDELSLENLVLDSTGLREFLRETKQVFEVGGKEKIISSIEPLTRKDRQYAKVLECHLYDVLTDQVFCQVWNGAISQWDEDLQNEITEHEEDSWRDTYEIELAPHLTKRYQQLKQDFALLEKQTTSNKKQTKLSVLRGIDIRKSFLNSFKETKRKMLMVSPWISENVVDGQMFSVLRQFAEAGNTLYIAWGIAKRREGEDRAPDQDLIDRLQAITHPDGTPAVFIRWFGNQHNKEIVIDQATLLLGSFNWLSYRGDYNLRNESVIVTPDPVVIKETTEHIEKKFLTALEQDLQQLLHSNQLQNTPARFNRTAVLHWLKEIALLDSFFEKRKHLINVLQDAIRAEENEQLLYDVHVFLITYGLEEFGAIEYLTTLLAEEDTTRAVAYYRKALKSLPLSHLWHTHEALADHTEWLDSFEEIRKQAQSKKQTAALSAKKSSKKPTKTTKAKRAKQVK